MNEGTMPCKVVFTDGGHDLFQISALHAKPGGKLLVLNRPGFSTAMEVDLDEVSGVYVLNSGNAGDSVAAYRRPGGHE